MVVSYQPSVTAAGPPVGCLWVTTADMSIFRGSPLKRKGTVESLFRFGLDEEDRVVPLSALEAAQSGAHKLDVFSVRGRPFIAGGAQRPASRARSRERALTANLPLARSGGELLGQSRAWQGRAGLASA